MMREMLKSKIHRATVTDSQLHYEGSITVDADLLARANILPGEKVHVVNVNNGARFETYTMLGTSCSGVICVNGAAARLALPGDIIIIISYAFFQESEIAAHHPSLVKVDSQNRPVE